MATPIRPQLPRLPSPGDLASPAHLCKLSCVLGLLWLQPTAHPPVTASLSAGLPHAYNSDPVKARTLFYLILVLSPGFA